MPAAASKPMYVVDLRAEIFADGRRIWRLFPGDSYRFLQTFLDRSVAFLDAPGLELPRGIRVDTSLADLNPRILRAAARGKWAYENERHARRGGDGAAPQKPSDDLLDFEGKSLSRAQINERGFIVNFFGEAKYGDIIVVPDSIPTRRVHAGVFIDHPGEFTEAYHPSLYGAMPIPARKIRWFKPIDELNLHSEVSDILRTSVAFISVPQRMYRDILDETYGSYQYAGEQAARVFTQAADFTDIDSLNLSLIARCASSSEWLSSQIGVKPGTIDDIYRLLDYKIPEEFGLSLSINIQSPGYISLKSAKIAPLTFLALFALFSSADPHNMPSPESVTVVNSRETATDDPCVVAVDEAVRNTLRLMRIDAWRQACERAQQLTAGPRLETSTVVRSEGTPAAPEE